MRFIVNKVKGCSPKKGKLHVAIANEVKKYRELGYFSGICKCGCGNNTELANKTRRGRNGKLYSVAGYPVEYIKGHAPNVAKGDSSLWFKGEETVSRSGYTMVYLPSHPRANKGRVAKHILVMEKYLGRYLVHIEGNRKGSEVVHHIDLDRSNNDISNLQLMTCEEHSRLHRALEGKRYIGCHRKGYNKLRRSEVLALLARYEEGESQATLAREYRVSNSTIWGYIHDKTNLPRI